MLRRCKATFLSQRQNNLFMISLSQRYTRATYRQWLHHSLLFPTEESRSMEQITLRTRQTHYIAHGPCGCEKSALKKTIQAIGLPGQKPATLLEPGKLTDTSTYPVVKQNLFQDCNIPRSALSQRIARTTKERHIPLWKFRLWVFCCVIVMTRFPSFVVMA
jgi:hypothetical protein